MIGLRLGKGEKTMAVYQWYPGHMTKAKRTEQEHILVPKQKRCRAE